MMMMRTWSLFVRGIEPRRQSGSQRHFDEEDDGVQQRLAREERKKQLVTYHVRSRR
jgi:hypothetical protein